jgi:hypothetical protein
MIKVIFVFGTFIAVSLLLGFILWWVVWLVSLASKLKQLRKENWKVWLNVLKTLWKERSENRLFYEFMMLEGGLAGVFPALAKLQLLIRHGGDEFGLGVELSESSEWLSFGIALLIALCYGLYLCLGNSVDPEASRKIVDACKLIDEELDFRPNAQWFTEQNKKQIKNLGKRYSPERNFPFKDMDYALASLRRSDGFAPLLKKSISCFQDELRLFIRKNERNPNYSKVLEECKTLLVQINGLNGDAKGYLDLREAIGKLLFKSLKDVSWSSRDVLSLHRVGEPLFDELSNQWIQFKMSHTILIVGTAGMGKSHLIGDMVTHRGRRGEPTILLLGQHFTSTSQPLSQIRDLLDIRCRKDRLLQQLNLYGERIDEPVVLFIDAINEGAGVELWRPHWEDFLQTIASFEYLRLVISFRVSERHNWFYDIVQDKSYAVYTHEGFAWHEQEAREYMFSSFGIEQPLWPVYGKEFANPLFLTTYCSNHARKRRSLVYTDFWTTILEYCEDSNRAIAQALDYNEAQKLVLKALRSVAKLMVNTKKRWTLPYEEVMPSLTQDAQYIKTPPKFMDLLIDEGLLRTEKKIEGTYVNFAYERIGDYFIAEYLIENIAPQEWLQFPSDYLSEALSILVPIKKGKEWFELVTGHDHQEALEAFSEYAMWRDVFTAKGDELISKYAKKQEYDLLFDIILSRPYRKDCTSNGLALYNLLWGMSMAQRDALWTVKISIPSRHGELLMDLARWACEASASTLAAVDEQSTKACLETLVWTLSSTWRELRDHATHGIVHILVQHKRLILPLLEKYSLVNDPYIEERLWCAVYGALLLLQDDVCTRSTAEWVYREIFSKQRVAEHILVRDYACKMVELGQNRGLNIVVEQSLIAAPFTDGTLPSIPSNNEIAAKYNRNWADVPEHEQEEYWAQRTILSSMATEYSGMDYGDFGRYVFQYHLESFEEDVVALSNWAVRMIFEEYEYDPAVFAHFDKRNQSHSRAHSKIERIGKKYQWIALYRIMARMMDRHPDRDWSDEWFDPIRRARTIDPTIYTGGRGLSYPSKYELPKFDLSIPKNDAAWLKAWMMMPKIEEYVFLTDEQGIEWVNLYSHSKLTYEPNEEQSKNRSLWTFIQAYIVRKQDLQTVCDNLYNYGTQSPSFHENRELYKLFSREFYWSSIYRDTVSEEEYQRIPFSVGYKVFEEIVIQPAYLQYMLSEENDATCKKSLNMIMPNEWLFEGLQLRFSNNTGIWVNDKNEMVVLDNFLFCGGHQALLVRKDYLLDYLNANGMSMFWPISTERMTFVRGQYANHNQSGGYAYLDEKGKIHQNLKCYESSGAQKWYGEFEVPIVPKTVAF